MIYIELKTLVFKKQLEWGRSITLTEIADATGISRMTLHRMVKNNTYNASTEHLDKICHYLDCPLTDLVRWEPNIPEAKINVA